MVSWGWIAIVLIFFGVLVIIFYDDGEKFVPLIGIQSSIIVPDMDLFDDSSHIKSGQNARITTTITSLSDSYRNDGILKIYFEHDEANQFFSIDRPEQEIYHLAVNGSSVPMSTTVSATIEPGTEYEDTLIIAAIINGTTHASVTHNIKIVK